MHKAEELHPLSSSIAQGGLPNRTRNRRYEQGRKIRAWTSYEDEILLRHCDIHGRGQWSTAAELLPGRTNKQCRERYQNQLMNGIKAGEWTHEEDFLIRKLQQTMGNNWSAISAQLEGRTANSVKNRFNSASFRNSAVQEKEVDFVGASRKRWKLDIEVLQELDRPVPKAHEPSWLLAGPSDPRAHVLHRRLLHSLFESSREFSTKLFAKDADTDAHADYRDTLAADDAAASHGHDTLTEGSRKLAASTTAEAEEVPPEGPSPLARFARRANSMEPGCGRWDSAMPCMQRYQEVEAAGILLALATSRG